MTENININIWSIFKVLIICYLFKSKNDKNPQIFVKSHFPKSSKSLEKMNNSNQDLILKEKEEFMNYMQKYTRGNISSIKYLFIGTRTSYDNLLMILNKAIFYCELVGCKKIILDKKYYWFINKNFKLKKYKMIITTDYRKNLEYNNIIIDHTLNFITYNKFILPENKIYLFKDEILKNLPKVKTRPDELYIYIKSGDIFMRIDPLYHIQSPICFYHKVIDNYSKNFTNITIVSELDKNIGINNLQLDYPNITFNVIPFRVTFAYLIKAYNIASGNCPLLYFVIQLNDNLRNIWEYDSQNDINNEKLNIENAIKNKKNKNITYYKMITKKSYKDKQLYSKDTFDKLYLMFNEKCENFTVIKH